MKKTIFINGLVIKGSGRGKVIGVPTVNIDPSSAPKDFTQGIYACFITLSGQRYQGAMHYGPRPVFKDSLSLEVHILDEVVIDVPDAVDIEIVGRIRDVQDFGSKEELLERISKDIVEARGMLERA